MHNPANNDIPFRRHALADARVACFRLADERAELARINRLTGLTFESLPQSLLDDEPRDALSANDAQRTAVSAPPAAAVRPKR